MKIVTSELNTKENNRKYNSLTKYLKSINAFKLNYSKLSSLCIFIDVYLFENVSYSNTRYLRVEEGRVCLLGLLSQYKSL